MRELTEDRRRKANDRLKTHPDLAWWREVLGRLVKSPLATGRVEGRNGARPWRADFDWLVKNDRNAVRVLEGGNFASEEQRPYSQF